MFEKIKVFIKPGSRTLTRSAFSGTNLSKALSKFHFLVKEHLDDIILLVGVILISLLSFAVGFIVAKQQEKEPLRIEMINEFTNQYEFTNSYAEPKRGGRRDLSLRPFVKDLYIR